MRDHATHSPSMNDRAVEQTGQNLPFLISYWILLVCLRSGVSFFVVFQSLSNLLPIERSIHELP